jgi:glucose-6-phosphate isomerase
MTTMNVDLTEISGLPISLDLETGQLTATGDVDLGEQGERRLSQLREVLADPKAATDDRICYRTYRGVGTKSDLEMLEKHGLRYDITVILPGVIGREFTKTAGHEHSGAPEGDWYPEIYEVLHGTAVFVLQEVPSDAEGRMQICRACERIIIPGRFGHLTINITGEPLVVSDLVASACANDYSTFRKMQGSSWYVIANGSGFLLERNPKYVGMLVPEIGFGTRVADLIPDNLPLIHMFRRNPDDFRLLTEPNEFFDDLFDCWY